MGDVETLIDELEASLDGVRAVLRRERRRAGWSRRLDRLATAAILLMAPAAFMAAAAPLPSRVKAPFTVTEEIGRVFSVSDEPAPNFVLHRPSGERGVGAIAGATPRITVWGQDPTAQAVVGIVGENKPTLALHFGGGTRVSLIGVDVPTLNLTNDNIVTVVELGMGPRKSGHLRLGDAQGNTMAEAGMTRDAVGAVQVFPNGGNAPGRTFFGLPGTFICGVGCGR